MNQFKVYIKSLSSENLYVEFNSRKRISLTTHNPAKLSQMWVLMKNNKTGNFAIKNCSNGLYLFPQKGGNILNIIHYVGLCDRKNVGKTESIYCWKSEKNKNNIIFVSENNSQFNNTIWEIKKKKQKVLEVILTDNYSNSINQQFVLKPVDKRYSVLSVDYSSSCNNNKNNNNTQKKHKSFSFFRSTASEEDNDVSSSIFMMKKHGKEIENKKNNFIQNPQNYPKLDQFNQINEFIQSQNQPQPQPQPQLQNKNKQKLFNGNVLEKKKIEKKNDFEYFQLQKVDELLSNLSFYSLGDKTFLKSKRKNYFEGLEVRSLGDLYAIKKFEKKASLIIEKSKQQNQQNEKIMKEFHDKCLIKQKNIEKQQIQQKNNIQKAFSKSVYHQQPQYYHQQNPQYSHYVNNNQFYNNINYQHQKHFHGNPNPIQINRTQIQNQNQNKNQNKTNFYQYPQQPGASFASMYH